MDRQALRDIWTHDCWWSDRHGWRKSVASLTVSHSTDCLLLLVALVFLVLCKIYHLEWCFHKNTAWHLNTSGLLMLGRHYRQQSWFWECQAVCSRMSSAVVGRWSVRVQSTQVMEDCFVSLPWSSDCESDVTQGWSLSDKTVSVRCWCLKLLFFYMFKLSVDLWRTGVITESNVQGGAE